LGQKNKLERSSAADIKQKLQQLKCAASTAKAAASSDDPKKEFCQFQNEEREALEQIKLERKRRKLEKKFESKNIEAEEAAAMRSAGIEISSFKRRK
jgi:hypothetical protein